jgi:hypothetical protein
VLAETLMTPLRPPTLLATLLLAPTWILAACGSDDGDESPAGGSAGSAGSATAGSSSGGSSARGGSGGSGKGGSSDGGAPSGSAGNSATVGGAGGSAGDVGAGGSAGSDQPGAGGAGGSLDDCFEGLRDPVGAFQDAEKASLDTTYRMRVALETGDRLGTSGTYAWLPIRLGLQTPDGIVCITDEELLAAAYTGSHHNCGDVLSFSDGGRDYTITSPDTTVDYVDPTIWVRPSMLTISEGAETLVGPLRLDTTVCITPNVNDNCSSGGPC